MPDEVAAQLVAELGGGLAAEVLAGAYARLPGLTLLSSFGAESAVLLAMAADIDPAFPVLFLDTGKHFPETLAYRDLLVECLGLTAVRCLVPEPRTLAGADPDGDLWGGRSRCLLRPAQDQAARRGARRAR